VNVSDPVEEPAVERKRVEAFGPPAVVASDPRQLVDLAWSPDGRRIALVDGTGTLGVVDRSGDRQPLVPGEFPSWMPDGQRLVFSRDGDLWITKIDAPKPEIFARKDRSSRQQQWSHPVCSPTGEWVVFECRDYVDSAVRRKTQRFGLVDGTGRQFEVLLMEASSGFGVWSPKGSWLACCNYEAGARFHLMRPKQLPELMRTGRALGFSPDETRLAFRDGVEVCLLGRREEEWQLLDRRFAASEGDVSSDENPIGWLDDEQIIFEEGGVLYGANVKTGEELVFGELDGLVPRGVASLAWSPDRRMLAAEVLSASVESSRSAQGVSLVLLERK